MIGGAGQSGGGAGNGLLSGSALNAVDVTLVVFFSVFGVALILACGVIAFEFIVKRGRTWGSGTAHHPMSEPAAVSYQGD